MQYRYSFNAHVRCSVFVCRLIFVTMVAGGSIGFAQPKPARNPLPSSIDERPGATAQADNRLPGKRDVVTLTVSVDDPSGNCVPGLQLRDFTLSDNQVRQQITYFSDEDLPASIAVVFDVSGSMNGRSIAGAREALANFVTISSRDDEYFLIAFNSRSQLLLDRSREGNALIRKLAEVKRSGDTALYDATYLALERIAHGTYKKRAILLVSDGEDNQSRHSLRQLRRFLLESDATVYAIDTNDMPLPKESHGRMVLDELATKSGGKMYWPENTAEMNEAFDRIAIELHHQYLIEYRPLNFAVDDKWHRLKVKVTPPPDLKRISVRAREGYYAVQLSPDRAQ
jgi:Ca-activated chloride channel family protein